METSIEAAPAPEPRPWGFWATVGFSVLVFIVFFLVQVAVLVPYVAIAAIGGADISNPEFQESLGTNGFVVSLALCVSTPICIGLIVGLAYLRKGISISEYLALNAISKKQMTQWLLLLIVYAASVDGLTFLLGRPVVPEVQTDWYQSAEFVVLLWFALIIAAPLFEEFYIRGFLFTGIQHSLLGTVGAILISSLVWASLHVQYDLYGITVIFCSGILMGVVRWKSGSIYPCIAMHVLMNIIATTETAIKVAMQA